MIAFLISALLMAAVEPIPPATTPAAPGGAAPAAIKAKASEKICWNERPAGSHVIKRMCATNEELAKAQRDSQDAVSGVFHGGKKDPLSQSSPVLPVKSQ